MAHISRLVVVDASVVLKWLFDDEECVSQAVALRDDFLSIAVENVSLLAV